MKPAGGRTRVEKKSIALALKADATNGVRYRMIVAPQGRRNAATGKDAGKELTPTVALDVDNRDTGQTRVSCDSRRGLMIVHRG
ncbi:hypothetical protein HDG37_007662 [Paraburkholderia sp. MM5384-R2]|nr:hypothetical protein [Paraburkholderia sp. MM5384-R2]